MPGPCAAGAPLPHDSNAFAVCDLDTGHDGPHADLYEGWEWSRDC